MSANDHTGKRHILICVWQPNEKWYALSNEERRTFLEKIGSDANAAREAGMDILGWGSLERGVSNPPSHSFCGVFSVDGRDGLYAIDKAIGDAGWYDYFDHRTLATELLGRDGVDAGAALCDLLGVS
jgi:hypothetical protein